MNIKLRKWNLEDLDNLVKYANNIKIAKFMIDAFPNPYTKETGVFYIQKIASSPTNFIFAIEIEGQAVGSVGLYPKTDVSRKNAELGYWLGEPFWGKGIVPEAIKQIVKMGFEQLDISRIYARVYGTNHNSKRVLEKIGFVLEAKLDKTIYKNEEYLDEWIYAVRANNF